MNQIIIQIQGRQCELCLQGCDQTFEYQCIEQNIQICRKCWYKLIEKKWQKNDSSILYQKRVKVIFSSTQYYRLQYQLCEICLMIKISAKICKNNHFFCFSCSNSYISSQMSKREIKCPMNKCDQVIDDFTIVTLIQKKQFKEWTALSHNLQCPKKKCEDVFRFSPYKQVETYIIRLDKNESQCAQCSAQICNFCWTQFKGNYLEHQMICNSEQFQDFLFKQYLNLNGIQKCPKCKFYCDQLCSRNNGQIKHCQLCQVDFCKSCLSGNLCLFSNSNLQIYQCLNCNQQPYRKSCVKGAFFVLCLPFQLLFLLIFNFLTILLIPLQIFLEIGARATKYVKKKVTEASFPYKYYAYYIFYPIIIVFEICRRFFAIAVQIQPQIFKCIKEHLFSNIDISD